MFWEFGLETLSQTGTETRIFLRLVLGEPISHR